MSTIKTKSFEIATYEKGNRSTPKLALVLPGRLDTKDYPHMRGHVDFLASKGYLALSFDPPGTWESPGDIDLYTQTNYVKAVDETIEYFGNKPTILIGHSRGGTIAMLAGARNDYVTHIIAVMSHTDPSSPSEEDKERGFQISYRDLPFDNTEKKRFNLPMSYFEDAQRYNVLENLNKSSKPKLFFLGTKDELVLPEEVREIYEASANPKQLYELNSDHYYRHHNSLIEEVNEVIGEFLAATSS